MNWIDLFFQDAEQRMVIREKITIIAKALNEFRKTIDRLTEHIGQFEYDKLKVIPDRTKNLGENWANYGWVPCFPWFKAVDVIDVLLQVENADQANKIMFQSIEQHSIEELFKALVDYCRKFGHNSKTLYDSINAYEQSLYSACCLCLFSIIDSCFIYGQPIEKEKRRALPRNAVSRSVNIDYFEFLVIPYSAELIIEKMYANVKDFSIEEDALYRNFISHGMNKYNPDKLDCLKLFTLLYNIYELFDAEVFSWDKTNG